MPLLLAALILTSCATIDHGSREEIRVDSDPAGASIGVDCGTARHHPRVATPATITIPRRAATCQLLISKPGYLSQTVELRRTLAPGLDSNFNGAKLGIAILDAGCCDDYTTAFGLGTMLGGALFGGFGLAVDHATGAMYEHQPRRVVVALEPEQP